MPIFVIDLIEIVVWIVTFVAIGIMALFAQKK